ncbi:MAG: toll/interleukin-1 receptor domain-containing protein, partial [Pseudomonadota bacterium]
MRYRAFISYSHRDEAMAQRLHRRLERYRPPRGLTLSDGARPERLHPIYRDRDEMAASPSLPAAIEAALAASDHLIVLCSPAAAQSAWVNEEIRLFAEIASPDRIVPVVVDGDPPACFPPALLNLLEEPLAPDLRDGKDGFADGVLKTIAGLWGVPLGALKDREAARQRGRARVNAAVAALVSGLAVFAGFSEWRALEQERRAEAEAEVAEARSLASIARYTFDRNPGETSVAAMVAVQSLSQSSTPEARELLRDALKLAPFGATEAPFPWRSGRMTTSRDGRFAAFASAYSSEDPPARSEVVRLTPDLEERDRIAFDGLAEPVLSADGARMAVFGRLRRVLVQDLSTGETVLDQPTQSGGAAAFSPDGATIYAATQLGDILRWSDGMSEARVLTSLPSPGARRTLPRLSVSSTGAWLLRAELEQPVTVISTEDGSARAAPHTPRYEAVSWREQTPSGAVLHPDGAHLVDYDTFGVGAFRPLDTLAPKWSFDDKSRWWSADAANVISNDGALYARGGGKGAVVVRDMSDGAARHQFDHGGAVHAIAFLGGGRRLIVAGDGGASIWTLGDAPAAETARCAGDADLRSMAVDPGGASFLVGAKGGRLIRCDPVTGAALAERDFGAAVTSVVAPPGPGAHARHPTPAPETGAARAVGGRETRAATTRAREEPGA